MKQSGLSIGQRLAIGLSVILAITTGATGYAVWSLRALEQDFRQLASDSMAQERNAQEWINILTLSGARNLVSAKFGDDAATTAVFNAFNLGDSTTLRARVTELQKDIFGNLPTTEGKQLVDDAMAKRKVYLERLDANRQLAKDGKKDEAQKLAETTVQPALKVYIVSTHTLLDHTRKMIAGKQVEMQAATERARLLLIALAAAALLLAGVIAWLLARSITAPLKQAVDAAEKVAAGDLRSSINITRHDETGALLGAIATMQSNLKDLIGNVHNDIGAVSASARQLARDADELSNNTAQQSEAAASTAAAVQELTGSIAQMSDSARMAQEVVRSEERRVGKECA